MYFAQNEESLLRAYVESGEGIDRAGVFAIQVSCPLSYLPSVSLPPSLCPASRLSLETSGRIVETHLFFSASHLFIY